MVDQLDVVIMVLEARAERFTHGAILAAWRPSDLRAAYCPECGVHYTLFKPPSVEWAPTIVHVICSECGGEGVPSSLEAPR